MYIKREDAMKVIYKLDLCLTNSEYFAHDDLMRAIPAADVRPAIYATWEEGSGDWLYGTDATKDYKCSNCKSEFVEGGKYCPECGATMRKEERQ